MAEFDRYHLGQWLKRNEGRLVRVVKAMPKVDLERRRRLLETLVSIKHPKVLAALRLIAEEDTSAEIRDAAARYVELFQTPEDYYASIQELFILEPRYKDFVEGFSRVWAPYSQPDWGQIWPVYAFIFAFALLIPLAGSSDDGRRLACVLAVLFAGLSVAYGYLQISTFFLPRARKLSKLRKQGRLIDGKVVFSRAHDTRDGEREPALEIIVEYQFTSPRSQETITGVHSALRIDMKREPGQKILLPKPHTPVKVLYADDENYLIM